MKNVLLLIGQKGSGKSFVGSLLEKEFGIKFIRVEDWINNIKRDRNIYDEEYITKVFQIIEDGIRKELEVSETICFESLGLSDQFDKMVENLGRQFRLTTIKILCDSEQCIERIRLRDKSVHISISDEQIREVNTMVVKRNYKTNYEIWNKIPDKNYLMEELKKILIESNVPVKI